MNTKHRHFIMHKPVGVISQFLQVKKRKKKLLGDLYDFPEGTMAIGRLDVKSEGLLLLTTNGKVSMQVRSKEIEKEYYVELDGIITDAAIELLKEGVTIGFNGIKYKTLPCKAFKLAEIPNFPRINMRTRGEEHGPTSWASIIISEGKFRQVRKMTAAVGFPTLRLIRVRIGDLKIGDLANSQVVEMEDIMLAVNSNQ